MPPLDDSYSFRSIPRRPPQVPHVSFPPSTCHFYYKRFRVVIGLRLVLQPYPRLQPVNDFCSSGQRFALGLVGSPNPASFRFHLTMDTLAFGYVLPTTGRTPDLHRLETCAAGRTRKAEPVNSLVLLVIPDLLFKGIGDIHLFPFKILLRYHIFFLKPDRVIAHLGTPQSF